MQVSDAGLNLIKEFEGCYLTAYFCPASVLTIGYGHTSAAGAPAVRKGMRITKFEAEEILRRDLGRVGASVEALATVPLTQNQFDVLVSFVFNCGAGALKSSTLLKKLNKGRYDDIPAELMKWTKGGGKTLPGLVRRRRAEAAMWRAYADEPNVEQSSVVPDAPPPARSIASSKEATGAIVAGASATVAGVSEVVSTVKDNSDLFSTLSSAVGKPVFIAMIVIVLACAGIWYWRKQRLDEEGT